LHLRLICMLCLFSVCSDVAGSIWVDAAPWALCFRVGTIQRFQILLSSVGIRLACRIWQFGKARDQLHPRSAAFHPTTAYCVVLLPIFCVGLGNRFSLVSRPCCIWGICRLRCEFMGSRTCYVGLSNVPVLQWSVHSALKACFYDICFLATSHTFIQSRLLLIWFGLVLSLDVEAWRGSVQCTSRFMFADGLYSCCSAVNIDWPGPDSNIMMSHLGRLLIMLTFLWFVYSH